MKATKAREIATNYLKEKYIETLDSLEKQIMKEAEEGKYFMHHYKRLDQDVINYLEKSHYKINLIDNGESMDGEIIFKISW